MKQFVITETKKALGRLKGTLAFIVRATFIALVNVAFWFLPLFLLGYATLRPFIASYRDSWSGQQVEPMSRPGDLRGNNDPAHGHLDLRDTVRSAKEIIRSIQNLRRK